jgi:hypothetical protein
MMLHHKSLKPYNGSGPGATASAQVLDLEKDNFELDPDPAQQHYCRRKRETMTRFVRVKKEFCQNGQWVL